MNKIGIVLRGKYGRRFLQTLKKHDTNKEIEIKTTELPEEILPEFIEEPGEFLESLQLDLEPLKCDLVIIYALHPDLAVELARLAGELGACAVLIPGRGLDQAELERIAQEYNVEIEVHEVCCEKSILEKHLPWLGSPLLEITTQDNRITEVKVVRGAPCGSTWHLAQNLPGTPLEEAPARAGLLIQQYPCRAQRGTKQGIHLSASLHKEAVEKALKKR